MAGGAQAGILLMVGGACLCQQPGPPAWSWGASGGFCYMHGTYSQCWVFIPVLTTKLSVHPHNHMSLPSLGKKQLLILLLHKKVSFSGQPEKLLPKGRKGKRRGFLKNIYTQVATAIQLQLGRIMCWQRIPSSTSARQGWFPVLALTGQCAPPQFAIFEQEV